MKNLLAGLLVAVTLVPAAQVRTEELQRGRDELVTSAMDGIKAAAGANKKHTWVTVKHHNFSQKYAFQKELQKNGYDFDIPMFGSTWIGW